MIIWYQVFKHQVAEANLKQFSTMKVCDGIDRNHTEESYLMLIYCQFTWHRLMYPSEFQHSERNDVDVLYANKVYSGKKNVGNWLKNQLEIYLKYISFFFNPFPQVPQLSLNIEVVFAFGLLEFRWADGEDGCIVAKVIINQNPTYLVVEELFLDWEDLWVLVDVGGDEFDCFVVTAYADFVFEVLLVSIESF